MLEGSELWMFPILPPAGALSSINRTAIDNHQVYYRLIIKYKWLHATKPKLTITTGRMARMNQP